MFKLFISFILFIVINSHSKMIKNLLVIRVVQEMYIKF